MHDYHEAEKHTEGKDESDTHCRLAVSALSVTFCSVGDSVLLSVHVQPITPYTES